MKKIVKVSIARFSFTLEESAHILLDNYINDLKAFYTPSGEQDVVDGIEERIAELLLERSGKDNVVTLAMVDEIISILGKPEDIENSTEADKKLHRVPKKRLYRDPQNKVVSGVCGGIAAYTGVDVVFVRIIFAIVLCLLSAGVSATASVEMPAVLVSILFYFALVAIIPKAVTVEQRCQMRGEAEDVHQIRRNVIDKDYPNMHSSSVMGDLLRGIGRVMAIILGVVLIFISISGLIGGLFILIGIDSFAGISAWELPDLITLNVEYPIVLKLSLLLVCMLPLIGMLYGGVLLCFKLESPKWRPGLLIFILWIISLVVCAIFSFMALKPYSHHNVVRDEILLSKQYDTLYINCPNTGVYKADQKFYFDAGKYSLTAYYENERSGEREFVVYPRIFVHNDREDREDRCNAIVATFNSFSKVKNVTSDYRAEDIITIKDSLITLKPVEISKSNKFNGDFWEIDLYLPEETVVVVTQPKHYEFLRDKED